MISVRPATRPTLSSRTLRTFYRDLTLETMAATRVLQPDTGNSINLRHGEMAISTSHLGLYIVCSNIGSYSSILILTLSSNQYLNITSSWDIILYIENSILTHDFVVKLISHVLGLFVTCCSIMSTWYWPYWAINTWSYSNVPHHVLHYPGGQYITQFNVTK